MTGENAPRNSGLGWVGIASLVTAVAGYAVVVASSRLLTVAENSLFLVFWSALFLGYGVLGGLQNEVTRAVADQGEPQETRHHSGLAILPMGLAIGLALGALIGATSPLWATGAFGPSALAASVALVLGIIAFSGHASLAGVLAGRSQWRTYSLLVGAESLMRLVLVAAVALVAWSVASLELAVALASFTWVALVAFDCRARSGASARVDGSARQFLRGAGQAMLATAATAGLVVGFPVMLSMTTPASEYLAAAPLLLAISFTRAPLMLAVNAYQGVLITSVVQRGQDRRRLVLRLLAVIAAVGVVGALAAAAIGPWLMVTILGPDYWLAPLTLALLTLAAVLLAALTVTGAVTLAVGKHGRYLAGWASALIAAMVILLLPGDITGRSIMSLTLGPIIGIAVHGVAFATAAVPGRTRAER